MSPNPPLILASASPRRAELLTRLNLTFKVVPADVDESFTAQDNPFDLVRRLSAAKADKVAQMHPDALVLAADIIVVFLDEIMGKPESKEENLGVHHAPFGAHARGLYRPYLCPWRQMRR